MFGEDIDLLPAGTVKSLADDCLERGQNAYDLFEGLFRQMNSDKPAKGGRFKGVRYFNGGLFATIEPVDLRKPELLLVGGEDGAATRDWSKVNPRSSARSSSTAWTAKSAMRSALTYFRSRYPAHHRADDCQAVAGAHRRCGPRGAGID